MERYISLSTNNYYGNQIHDVLLGEKSIPNLKAIYMIIYVCVCVMPIELKQICQNKYLASRKKQWSSSYPSLQVTKSKNSRPSLKIHLL